MKKVADLKQWEHNPRKISVASKRILQKTMDEFGDLSGIIYNRTNGQLVGGNQRSTILGTQDEITLVEEYAEPTAQYGTIAWGFVLHDGEKFKYREVVWDESRHAAAAIAANKGGGEWDWQELPKMLSDLDANGWDLELTGFDEIEAENILGGPVKESEMPEMSSEDRGPLRQMSFVIHESQQQSIEDAIKKAIDMGPFDSENDNKNGNALVRICESFVTYDS